MYVLEDKILPISKKLKIIRKYLGLKQEELTNGSISRSLISYIENGKVELTEDTAKVIAKCMQKKLDQKKSHFKIDEKYLMSNEKEQAEILVNRYITKLKKYKEKKNKEEFNENRKIVESILDKWDLRNKKLEVYEIIGDYYFDIFDYCESYIYYVRALKNSIQLNNDYNYAKVITKVGRCCIKTNMYWQAIKYNDYALTTLKINHIEDDKLTKRCLFNNALAYNYLEKYSECIEELMKLENSSLYLTIEESIDILMLKGNCYRNKGELYIAEQVYEQVVYIAKTQDDKKILAMVYTNISALYTKDYKINEAIDYDKKALKIRAEIGDEKIVINLLVLGKKYKTLQQYDIAEKYLLRGLKQINKKKNLKIYVKICIELLETYSYTDEHYLILNLIGEMKETYEKIRKEVSEQKIDIVETFFLKAAKYLVTKDDVGVEKLLTLLLERKVE